MKKTMNERLREIRVKAGFRSASEAAKELGWTPPTYAAHENGTRGFGIDLVELYAKAFNADPVWLAFGISAGRDKIANISENVLTDVLVTVLSHDFARNAKPELVAELVIEICRYVHKSGSTGMGAVVDFQMEKLARSA